MNVAIVTPTYDRIDHLKELFESIKSQTYTDFIWLILNDGSNISLNEWDFLYEDKRVILVHKEHTGIADTRKCALSLIRAEDTIVVEIDDHDVMVPTCVERIINTFKEFGADMVYGDHKIMGSNQYVRKPEYYNGAFKLDGNHAIGIRAYNLLKARLAGGYRLEDEYAEDYSLFLRMEAMKHKFVKAWGFLGHIRIEGNSISVKNYPEMIRASNRCRDLALKGALG